MAGKQDSRRRDSPLFGGDNIFIATKGRSSSAKDTARKPRTFFYTARSDSKYPFGHFWSKDVKDGEVFWGVHLQLFWQRTWKLSKKKDRILSWPARAAIYICT